jgi:hypothetical protein
MHAVKDNLATSLLNDEEVNGTTRSAADLPCSRNARPQKALVGRAQWEATWPALKGRWKMEDGRVDLSVNQATIFE